MHEVVPEGKLVISYRSKRNANLVSPQDVVLCPRMKMLKLTKRRPMKRKN